MKLFNFIIFFALILRLSVVIAEQEVQCGTHEHWEQVLETLSKLSSNEQDLLILELKLAILKAQEEMLTDLLKTAPAKRGPQAYRELARYGKKLEQKFNCTKGLD
jgi:hypothetical protein